MPFEDLFDPSSGDPYRGGWYRPPAYSPPGGGGGAQGAAGGAFGDFSGQSPGYRPFVNGVGTRRRLEQPAWTPRTWNPRGMPTGLPAGPVTGGAGGGAGGVPAGFWDAFTSGSADVGDWNRLATLIASGNGPAGTAFDPAGDPRELRAIFDAGQTDALDRGRRAYLSAYSEAPNDPGLAGYMRLKGQLGAMSDTSRAATAARLAAIQRAEAFRQLIAQAIIGSNLQRGLANQNYGLQNSLQQGQGGGFGDWLGQVSGDALGGWLSPGGLFRGKGK